MTRQADAQGPLREARRSGSATVRHAAPPRQERGLALRQYYIDRDGNPVLTRDGQPVHTSFDERGREVLAEDGRPLVVPVDIPEGSRVEPHARGT
jgi:hypothetical protein